MEKLPDCYCYIICNNYMEENCPGMCIYLLQLNALVMLLCAQKSFMLLHRTVRAQ